MNIYYNSIENKKNVDTQIFIACTKCGRPIMMYTTTFFCGYPSSETVEGAVVEKLVDMSNEYCPKCGTALNPYDDKNNIFNTTAVKVEK